ncbi:cupin domain-containing protein [Dactylosporangium sucinum]|uniref:LuxR family transcriptional regulator n=1 Tax=Dactylosporangium sucinum TaxID=1424081 RepID=A0A917U4H5_9ACTN|nr:cupin domain-containing protein [Dactylosporangium sucinum]GGM56377.1 LuxR family transcriptional regulator [Dactylosporangium sucinum]
MEAASLVDLVEEQLAAAVAASSGRSARTVVGGQDKRLRQAVIALAGGERLDEHENPGEATVQVLRGEVRMVSGADSRDAVAGELLVVPDARHSLEALTDAVVLLTVAKGGT